MRPLRTGWFKYQIPEALCVVDPDTSQKAVMQGAGAQAAGEMSYMVQHREPCSINPDNPTLLTERKRAALEPPLIAWF